MRVALALVCLGMVGGVQGQGTPPSFLEAAELISFVGQRIASYKKPHFIDFVDELPSAKDGSPDRVKIKELHGGPQE